MSISVVVSAWATAERKDRPQAMLAARSTEDERRFIGIIPRVNCRSLRNRPRTETQFRWRTLVTYYSVREFRHISRRFEKFIFLGEDGHYFSDRNLRNCVRVTNISTSS